MKKFILANILGLTVLLGLGPFEFFFAGIIHSSVLFYLSTNFKSKSEIFKTSILISFFISIYTFQWVFYSVYLLSGKIFYALISFLVYVLISNIKIYFLFLGIYFLKKRFSTILIFPILLFLTDRFVFQIFPWYFGNLISGNIFLKQFASISGVYGLSFMSGIFGVLFYISFISIKSKRMRLKKIALVYSILCLFLFCLGFYKIEFFKPEISKYIKIGMIQPATRRASLENKGDENFAKESIADTFNIALKSIFSENFSLDILAIPESAIPFHGTRIQSENESKKIYSKTFHGIVQFLSKYSGSTVVFNELDNLDGEKNLISSIIPSSKEKFSYSKKILLPFGEYLPFEKEFPFLRRIFPEAGNYSKGENDHLLRYTKQLNPSVKKFSVEDLKQVEFPEKLESLIEAKNKFEEGNFLGLICYEAMYSENTRDFFKIDKIDFILNLTNDSWFGEYLENYQHDSVVKLRAVEFGKSFIRPTLTGVSSAYNYLGEELIPPSKILDKTYRIVDVPIYENRTIYTSFGDLFSWVFVLLFGIFSFRTKKNYLN